jgi:orotate phosphoribosyltransferase
MVISYSLEVGVVTERTKRILELCGETGALLQGDFTLASGKKSDHYYDGKMLILNPEGARLVGEEIFDRLSDLEVDAIGGLEIGAIPIVTAVSLISYEKQKTIPAFIVRDKAKEHGTKKDIEGHIKRGARVAIIDDVITTGGSVIKAIDKVKSMGCEVVKVVVIVDRQEGGSDIIKQSYDFDAIINLPPSGGARINEYEEIKGEAGTGILRR